MKILSFAGLAGLAGIAAHAQQAPQPVAQDPVVVTATRMLDAVPTLRDTIVITRDDLDAAGPLSLGEVLQRQAGIELRGLGGAGQPQSLFMRGAGSGQTLVLVDGMRVGSATAGTTAIEHLPLEMIERIEIVKGPMSSLYGADAIGGVIQVFTRRKGVPHLFATAGFGTDRDARVSGGIEAVDGATAVAMSAGYRRVDPPSATNSRSFFFNPDRDGYDNAFANLRLAQTLMQGETITLEAFGTRGRTQFDDGGSGVETRDTQTISGVKVTSSNRFADNWASKLSVGSSRDRLISEFPDFESGAPTRETLETRQDQATWINEFTLPGARLLAGYETVRQKVSGTTAYTVDKRNTNSVFGAINQELGGSRFEASLRHDDDDQFGGRTTGSASYGIDVAQLGRVALTYGRGFRAPTFNDLYYPGFSNPFLRPEHSDTWELSWRSPPSLVPGSWRVSAFDNRFQDLIVFSFEEGKPLNIASARSRGIEIVGEGTWAGTRLRGNATFQRPRDEGTGKQLHNRAERFGSFDAARDFGPWTAGLTLTATGPRFDSDDESPDSKLGGYVVFDARVRYRWTKQWSVELSGANLGDRHYENAVGYDAPRRSVFLSLRFEAF